MATIAEFFIINTVHGAHVTFPENEDEFEVVYCKHLKKYLERNSNFTEKKFIDFELRKVERMVNAVDIRTHDYDTYSDMLETYKRLLQTKQNNSTKQKKKTGPKPRNETRTLSDIINDRKYKDTNELARQLVATLRDDRVNVIDENENWIGTNKTIIAVWYLTLKIAEFQFIIQQFRPTAANILNNTIHGLGITSEDIRQAEKKVTKTEKDFQPIFQQLFCRPKQLHLIPRN